MKKYLTLILTPILICLAIICEAQFTIENLSNARENIAIEFLGDTILFVGGRGAKIAEIYNTVTREIENIQEYGSDGFSRAKVISNEEFAVFYDLVSVNLLLRDLYRYNKITNEWTDSKYSVSINEDVLFLFGNEMYSFLRSDLDSISVFNISTFDGYKIKSEFEEREFTIVESNNNIYCVGGIDAESSPSNAINIFNKNTGEWSRELLQTSRREPNVLLHQNKLIINGGFNDFSRKMEVYNIESRSSQIIDLPFNNRDGLLHAKHNTLILAGGDRNDAVKIDLSTLEVGEPYVLEPEENFGLDDMKAAILGDRVIYGGDRFPRIHIYNFSDDTWDIIPLEAAKQNAAVFSYKDKLYIAGGKSEDGELTDELLIFEDMISSNLEPDKSDTYISLFPNPASNQIHLNKNNNEINDFTIYNQNGVILSKGPVQNVIDISHLDSGIYYISLQFPNKVVVVKRFIVVK